MSMHCPPREEHQTNDLQAGQTDPLNVSTQGGEIVGALALIGLAGWFLIESQSLSGSIATSIGPATFPIGIALLLMLTALALLGSAIKRLLANRQESHIQIRRPLTIGIVAILLCAFPYAMATFGYYPTMGIWLFPFAWATNVRKPLPLIGLVIGFLLFSKLVFEMLLGTPLS